MKAVVAAFNQEKALVGAFSVITNLQMQLFEALVPRLTRCYLDRVDDVPPALERQLDAEVRPPVPARHHRLHLGTRLPARRISLLV